LDLSYLLLYLGIGSLLPPPSAYPSKYNNCEGLETGRENSPTNTEEFPQEDSSQNHWKYAREDLLKTLGGKVTRGQGCICNDTFVKHSSHPLFSLNFHFPLFPPDEGCLGTGYP